ncbi:MAG: hypothetical protein FJ275_01705 [Planctomycetes bacterium]|nr:hypothetical protein [Planctomycetota bacterium]MBM4056937.1 hypothetical protein [Planctomycetota bacterium]
MNHDDQTARPASAPQQRARISDAERLQELLEIRRDEVYETADQATDRCRAEAARDKRQRYFDATLAELLRVYDTTAADQQYSGMSLDEAGYFDEYLLADLVKHWRQMQCTFDATDREGYRKAAARFAGRAVCFGMGLRNAYGYRD